jgi:hypothetical protein
VLSTPVAFEQSARAEGVASRANVMAQAIAFACVLERRAETRIRTIDENRTNVDTACAHHAAVVISSVRAPFVDHIGIDLREESDIVRAGFKKLSNRADELGWGHIAQGGKGRPVYCCHIEVAEKRWIYPPPRPNGSGIPLEFAFGPLKMNDFKAGCDLRPSMPALREASARYRSVVFLKKEGAASLAIAYVR